MFAPGVGHARSELVGGSLSLISRSTVWGVLAVMVAYRVIWFFSLLYSISMPNAW